MVRIHPTALIEGDVSIGEGTSIGAYCVLIGPITIGKNNRINPHVVIGTEAEHRSKSSVGKVIIGDRNILTEFSVVTRGSGERDTQIGNDCFFLDHVHMSHDCYVGNNVTLSHNVVLAGHTHILDGANLGIGAVTHQFTTVGAHAMVGMGSVVTRDVPPFALVKGNPARFSRWNAHALKNLSIDLAQISFRNQEMISDHDYVIERWKEFKPRSRRSPLQIS